MTAMDPAEKLFLEAHSHLQAINEATARGDSDIQKFYEGATVFVTGGSGFVGKQLIEKLLRSCALKKIYLLLRSRKGMTIQERWQNIMKCPLFDLLLKQQPNVADKIVLVEGNISDLRLGLSDENWSTLTKEVSIIFHAAALIQLKLPLRDIVFANLRGSREIITLARECANLRCFVHISTDYSFATTDRAETELMEQIYPCPITAGAMIKLAEELDDEILKNITTALTDRWGMTYTFTKALAENLIKDIAQDLPICIMRLPLVCSCYREPAPGWTDLTGAAAQVAIRAARLLGIFHVVYFVKHCKLPLAPLDYVNNAIIAAGWDCIERKKSGDTSITVYAIGSPTDNYDFVTSVEPSADLYSPKAVWSSQILICSNRFVYKIFLWLLHYIPAYILDAVFAITGKSPPQGIKSFVSLYENIHRLLIACDHFFGQNWYINGDNYKKMIERMNETDKIIYNCDITRISPEDFKIVCQLGIRKYIIKDELKGTEQGNRKQMYFKIINYVIFAIFMYILWNILCLSFNLVKYMSSLAIY